MSQEIVKTQEGFQCRRIKQRGFESALISRTCHPEAAHSGVCLRCREGLPGIKVGAIINSLTKEALMEEFIPIFSFKKPGLTEEQRRSEFRLGLWAGAIIWRSADLSGRQVLEQTKFGPNGENRWPRRLTSSYFPGVPMPVIVSFAKTSYRTGKQLLSLGRFCGGDMFSAVPFDLADESNNIGTYAVLRVTPVGDSARRSSPCASGCGKTPQKRRIFRFTLDTTEERPY